MNIPDFAHCIRKNAMCETFAYNHSNRQSILQCLNPLKDHAQRHLSPQLEANPGAARGVAAELPQILVPRNVGYARASGCV